MKKAVNFLAASLFAATAFAAPPEPVLAQAAPDPASQASARPTWEPTRLHFEDERVRVQEVTFRPGDEGRSIPRPFRVIRVLEGGTLQRTYPGGRTEKIEFRPGEVKVFPADPPFGLRNVGATSVVLFVVAIKEPK